LAVLRKTVAKKQRLQGLWDQRKRMVPPNGARGCSRHPAAAASSPSRMRIMVTNAHPEMADLSDIGVARKI
jgi:hypothetical protein